MKNVTCTATRVPSANTDVINDSYINYATLEIPTYKSTAPWQEFGTFKAIEEVSAIESVITTTADLSTERHAKALKNGQITIGGKYNILGQRVYEVR